MANILYLTSKSIYVCAAQRTLIDIIEHQVKKGHKVSVLLIQDSTLAARKNSKNIIIEAASKGISIYAQKEDLDARGILDENLDPNIKAVTYDQSIELIMEKNEKVITWC